MLRLLQGESKRKMDLALASAEPLPNPSRFKPRGGEWTNGRADGHRSLPDCVRDKGDVGSGQGHDKPSEEDHVPLPTRGLAPMQLPEVQAAMVVPSPHVLSVVFGAERSLVMALSALNDGSSFSATHPASQRRRTKRGAA